MALLGGRGKQVEADCGVPKPKALGARGQARPRLQAASGSKPFASPASPLRIFILPGFNSLLGSSLSKGSSKVQDPGLYLPPGGGVQAGGLRWAQGGGGKKQSRSPRLGWRPARTASGAIPKGSRGGGRGTVRGSRQGGIRGQEGC